MRSVWCGKCRSMQDHYIENEAVDKKCNMYREYVCSECGNRFSRRWGKAKTLKFLQGEHVGV